MLVVTLCSLPVSARPMAARLLPLVGLRFRVAVARFRLPLLMVLRLAALVPLRSVVVLLPVAALALCL